MPRRRRISSISRMSSSAGAPLPALAGLGSTAFRAAALPIASRRRRLAGSSSRPGACRRPSRRGGPACGGAGRFPRPRTARPRPPRPRPPTTPWATGRRTSRRRLSRCRSCRTSGWSRSGSAASGRRDQAAPRRPAASPRLRIANQLAISPIPVSPAQSGSQAIALYVDICSPRRHKHGACSRAAPSPIVAQLTDRPDRPRCPRGPGQSARSVGPVSRCRSGAQPGGARPRHPRPRRPGARPGPRPPANGPPAARAAAP